MDSRWRARGRGFGCDWIGHRDNAGLMHNMIETLEMSLGAIPEVFLIIAKICTLYSPLKIFLPISTLMFLVGLCYYLYTFFVWHRFTNMSALLFTSSVIIFMMGLVSEQISQMRFERSEGDELH